MEYIAHDMDHPAYYDQLRTRVLSGADEVTVRSSMSGDSAVYQVIDNRSATTTSSIRSSMIIRLIDVASFVTLTVNGTSQPYGYDNALAILLSIYHFNNPNKSPFLTGGNGNSIIGPLHGVPFDTGAINYNDYWDTNSSHLGNCDTSSEVDAKFVSDSICINRGGSCAVGWTNTNEWLSYYFIVDSGTIAVDVIVRASSVRSSKQLVIELDNKVNSTFFAPGLGFDTYADLTWSNVPVTAGDHSVRISFLGGNINVCSVSVYQAGNSIPAPSRAKNRTNLHDCNVRLTTSFFNDQDSPNVATSQYTQTFQRQASFATSPPVGGTIGADRSAVTLPLAILGNVHSVPQISGASTSDELDDKTLYPNFARTVTNTIGEAAAVVNFFKSLDAQYVAILYVSVSFTTFATEELFTIAYALLNDLLRTFIRIRLVLN
jgi:hypothetical protein